MKTARPARAPLSAVLVVLGCVAACDGTERPAAPTPPQTSAAVPREIQLEGPDTLPPGTSAQLTLVAVMSDGSRRDVSYEATWSSTSVYCTCGDGVDVLVVSPPGLLTITDLTGEAVVTARLGELSASKEVWVLPEGVNRLAGKITEAGSGATPVAGARIELIGDREGRQFTRTGADGVYRIYGVDGNALLRASMDGYQSFETRIDVTGHQVVNLSLTPLSGWWDY